MDRKIKTMQTFNRLWLIWVLIGCGLISVHAEENGQPVGASTNGIYASAT
jgi:hypothetical protein